MKPQRFWREALERQAELQRFQLERGMRPSPVELELAAKQELAEFGDRVKARWAWWKRRDRAFEEDREGALEELADALHFVLAGLLLSEARFRVGALPVGGARWNGHSGGRHLPEALVALYRESDFERLFFGVLGLAERFGFDEEQLFEAYFRKSTVNLERWRGA